MMTHLIRHSAFRTSTVSGWRHLVLCAVLMLASGCDNMPGKPDPANRPVAPDEVVNFDLLFQRNCTGCHGEAGKLGPAPPLNDPLFLAIVPDDVLQQVVTQGRHWTSMPVFSELSGGSMTDEQIHILATGLKPKWQDTSRDADRLPPYAGKPGNAANGAKVFATACATCHGDDGRGGMAGAVNDVAFLSLVSDQALRRIIITGRPDLGMPSFENPDGRNSDFRPLRSEEIDDLVALLALWRTGASVNGSPVE